MGLHLVSCMYSRIPCIYSSISCIKSRKTCIRMTDTLSPLNVRLRKTREARSLSLEELGKLAGINLGTISRLERKPQNAKFITLTKLSQVLEVSVAFLTGTEDSGVDFEVGLRLQALRRFLSINTCDEQQKRNFEELCLRDSAPNSVRGWQNLTQNCNFLHMHKPLD